MNSLFIFEQYYNVNKLNEHMKKSVFHRHKHVLFRRGYIAALCCWELVWFICLTSRKMGRLREKFLTVHNRTAAECLDICTSKLMKERAPGV